MVDPTTKRISAASARSHTRKPNNSSFKSGISRKIIFVLLSCLLAWAFQAIRPPPAKICGSPQGPPITALRIKLKDGRNLAYEEHGVPKETSKYKIVFIHPFDSCRCNPVIALDQGFVEEMGVYIVSFDRPGYGESDPNPKRNEKSIAVDVEELADELGLGSKFYVVGFSMGGQAVWGCLKYIPHRLAGAALIAPVVNYWWPGFPANLSKQAYYQQRIQDQWALRIVHYAPWLTYWWNTQKLFPASSVATGNPAIFSPQDLQLIPILSSRKHNKERIRPQGEFESIHRDMLVGFGNWEFDPMDLKNPLPNEQGSVHIWHGGDDRIVPVSLQRHIAKTLGWIKYHEIHGAGHLFAFAQGANKNILNSLLLDDE